MTIKILMPALSPTMTEGNLAKWHVGEGDRVNPGDVIAEIETDKASMEVEAVDEGTVGRLLVAEGTENVPVNAAIGLLLEEGEDAAALESAAAETEAPGAKDGGAETRPAATAAAPAKPAAPERPAAGASLPGGVRASPLARRMAAQAGLDLSGIAGSGPGGRIVKRDVEAAVAAPPPAAGDASEIVRLSAMRKVIARRMTEAKTQVPHFYLSMDCEIDELLKVRQALNEAQDGTRISVNDFVVRACALALMNVPDANVAYENENELRRFRTADVAVAVAVPGGLVTPVLRSAEAKGLKRISSEMKELSARARDGELAPEEYQGGSFSVSNLGMYGVKQFDAVINPPQACILAVGAGEPRPVVRDGVIVPATVMTCTLSVDHRVVDGATGAELLAEIRRFVAYPPAMLL